MGRSSKTTLSMPWRTKAGLFDMVSARQVGVGRVRGPGPYLRMCDGLGRTGEEGAVLMILAEASLF